jgi:AraC-like DNA-binding protein
MNRLRREQNKSKRNNTLLEVPFQTSVVQVKIFKFNTPHPLIEEVREIKADSFSDTLTHIVPPMGAPEIIFYVGSISQIKNTGCKNGFVKGQYNIVQKIDFIPNYHFLSIVLKPYGLKQLFGVNAIELLNAVVDVEAHEASNSLLANIKNQPIDSSLILQLAQRMLQFPTYAVSEGTKAFIQAVKTAPADTIKNIAKDQGLGLRTLQRNFKNEVGLTPSEYLRIIRINRIERRLTETSDVFELIADFDFTDQSHFVKEFKQWRNHAPKAFLRQKLLLSDQLPVPEYIYL